MEARRHGGRSLNAEVKEREREMVKNVEQSPEELRGEREKRIQDAIALRIPDRVPVTPTFGYFASKHCGFTYREAVYELIKVAAA